jgi:two-component system, chemotaxis family, protein-glutamate methylesterase/glutaminase
LLIRRAKTLSPGCRIRVLVVDDSASVRSLMTRALGGDPALQIVGTAANGVIGLAKTAQLSPHVITLDIEMPNMNGLEMLKRVRQEFPDVVVIMASTLTAPGATATLDALMLGAHDYITKPTGCGDMEQCMATLRAELLPKIKQFFTAGPGVDTSAAPIVRKCAAVGPPLAVRREVLALGVSTGGPNALSAIMPHFPVPFPHPVLIVQHMPPLFTKLLAERLQRLTKLQVEEATQGCRVEAGKILIAPGGSHMRVSKGEQGAMVSLEQTPARNSCRPSVDVLFESVNEVYGANTIAAVLTGMGQDGLRGAETLKASGAYIIAQDEATSVVWGMPGFVAKAGLADAVVPLGGIVPEVLGEFNRGLHRIGAAGK